MVGLRFDLARQGWLISWCEQACIPAKTSKTLDSHPTVLGLDRRMDGTSSLRRSMETPHCTAQGRRISIAAASSTDERAEQTSPDLRSSNHRVSEQTSPQIPARALESRSLFFRSSSSHPPREGAHFAKSPSSHCVDHSENLCGSESGTNLRAYLSRRATTLEQLG